MSSPLVLASKKNVFIFKSTYVFDIESLKMPSIIIYLDRVWRISPEYTKRGLSQAGRSSSFADRAVSQILSVDLGKDKKA